MTSNKNKPKIDTSRFNELLSQPQEIAPFAQPDKVEVQNHSIVCFAPARVINEGRYHTNMSLRLEAEVKVLLDNHTAGSRNTIINTLLKYAVQDLLNKNLTIK